MLSVVVRITSVAGRLHHDAMLSCPPFRLLVLNRDFSNTLTLVMVPCHAHLTALLFYRSSQQRIPQTTHGATSSDRLFSFCVGLPLFFALFSLCLRLSAVKKLLTHSLTLFLQLPTSMSKLSCITFSFALKQMTYRHHW